MKTGFLNGRFAAKYVREKYGIRCCEKWLAKLAVTGGGPRCWNDDWSFWYTPYTLDAWVSARVNGAFTSSDDCEARKAKTQGSSLRSSDGFPFAPEVGKTPMWDINPFRWSPGKRHSGDDLEQRTDKRFCPSTVTSE
jgi:hypothetical protein